MIIFINWYNFIKNLHKFHNFTYENSIFADLKVITQDFEFSKFMYNSLKILIILIPINFLLINCSENKTKIEISITGIKNRSVIIGYYYNNKMKPLDTIQIKNDSKGEIYRTSPLREGIYFIYLPNKTYFNFLIGDDQHFKIKTNLNDLVLSQKINGSIESEIFSEYQKILTKEYHIIRTLKAKLSNLDKHSSQYNKVNSEIELAETRLNLKTDSIFSSIENSFLKKILLLSKYSVFPPKNINRTHFFDNINFNDERFLYTPYFTTNLDFYFKTVIDQNVDTLIAESNSIISKSDNKEIRKYLIKYFFNLAATSKIPGIDAMIINMAENYYFSGEANWVDSAFLRKLKNKVTQLKFSTIGQQAPDLLMETFDGQYARLSEVRAPLTILLFWDPGCGHCKLQIPEIKKQIWDAYQNSGMKIFAVYTQAEKSVWIDFIEDYNLFDWINVYDPFFKTRFWYYYNIHSTPTYFVLDEEKKIIYKMDGDNFSIEKLTEIIDQELTTN